MASCATSPGRSRATPSSPWSRRATRRTRSSSARHDFAHVLAEAVQNLFPGTQITFGPATDDGFYYDFAPTAERGPFTEEELPAIEEEMRRIIRADKPLVREVWTREQLLRAVSSSRARRSRRNGRRSCPTTRI